MKDKENKKLNPNNARVVPEFHEHVDIEKLCQTLIEIAKSIAEEQCTNQPDGLDKAA